MRLREFRAIQVIAGLSQLPKGRAGITGEDALKLDEDQAARIYSRTERWAASGGLGAMSLHEVVRKSRQRARARQTHPGKRAR